MITIDVAYSKKIASLSLAFSISILAMQFGLKNQSVLNPYIWYILAYVVAIMYLSHLLIAAGFGKSPYDVQNFFMLGTGIKLLTSAVGIFLYFYIVKSNSTSFLLNFFVLYFVYSFFEIKTLSLSLHPNSKGGSSQ